MAALPAHPLVRCDRLDLQPWIDAFGVATAVADVLPDGGVHIVAVNDRFAAGLGGPPVGCRPADVVDGPAGRAFDTLFRRSVDTGRDVEGEVDLGSDARPHRVRVTIRPTAGRGGRPARLIAVLVDRTGDQHQLDCRERALADLRDAGRTLLDGLDVAAFQVSADGVVLAVNRHAAERFADGAEPPVGRRLEALLGGDSGRAAAGLVDRVVTTGQSTSLEMAWNGRRLNATADPLGMAGGTPSVVSLLVRDIADPPATVTDDHDRHLARCQRIASLGESTATLAHEMAQPLAAVVAYCRGAAARFGNGGGDHAELAEALTAACREAERAAAILRTVEGFVRPSPGLAAGADLAAVVAEIGDLLRADLDRAGIMLHVDVDEDLPTLAADPVELAQVVHNLLRNGIEALAGRTARELAVSARRDDGMVTVTVDDSGGGFRADLRDRLFTPFTTTKTGGLGMGLAICRTIVERHGGQISAGDAPAGGARIRFTLPLEEVNRVA